MCAIIKKAMKKRLLCLLLPIFLSLSGLFLIPINTYALPTEESDTTITNPNTDTDNPNSPNPDQAADENFSEEPNTTEEGSTEDTSNSTNSSEANTCYSQVGALGWLICPSTGFLSNLIDGAYNIIQQLLTVTPLSNNTDSPIYLVWEYLRNITNIIFII